MELVFRRVRERLERRGTTLAARIKAIAHPSLDGTLSQRDLRKVRRVKRAFWVGL